MPKKVSYGDALGVREFSCGVAEDVNGCCVVRKVPLCYGLLVSVFFECSVVLDDVVIACVELTEAACCVDQCVSTGTAQGLFDDVEPVCAGAFFKLQIGSYLLLPPFFKMSPSKGFGGSVNHFDGMTFRAY